MLDLPNHGPGLHHAAVFAADFEATFRFYTAGLGFDRAYPWSVPGSVGRAAFVGAPGGNYLELFERASFHGGAGGPDPKGGRPEEATLRTLAVRAPDLDAAYARALSAGGRPWDTAAGALPERVVGCLGPDGEAVELWEALGDPGPGLRHVGLVVADLDASVRRYAEGLGLAPADAWDNGGAGRTIRLAAGDGNFVVLAGRPVGDSGRGRSGGPLGHFALRVVDCDAAHARAKADGFRTVAEPARQTLGGRPPIDVRIAFVQGSDGESIELWALADGQESSGRRT